MLYTACQYCASGCTKTGKQKNGSQKVRCKNCGKYQQHCYSNKACKKVVKEAILKIYVKNVGIRDVADLLGISVNTVLKEIKQYSNYKKVIPYRAQQVYEIDEMRTYVGNKSRKRWIVSAIERNSKAVINIAVGRRTKSTLRKVTDAVLKLNPQKIYTDGYHLYKTLIPNNIHKVIKHRIQIIERMHLTARSKLKRLNRKTIAFSKSDTMLSASLKLLLWEQQPEKGCLTGWQ